MVLALFVASVCVGAPPTTNAVSGVLSVVSPTNAPAAKPPRRQCEAVTKSGNRCRRNASPGAKLCRQHQKISNRQNENRRRDYFEKR